MTFSEAIEDALLQAMSSDPRIVILGEDVPLLRRKAFVRFGEKRVRAAPISEAAFLGAAVGAAMAGLRPVVELYMIDFLGAAMDAVLNQAAKIEAFSGGSWRVPLTLRAPCGGGYGDGGQHEQALWGWLAHIPGLSIVVPSTPADAGGLLTAALEQEGPVLFFEHKLLSSEWLGFLGRGGREHMAFDVPAAGASGLVPDVWRPVPFGQASVRRPGTDITFAGVGVGIHRAFEAAGILETRAVSAEVIDLKTLVPLDKATVLESVAKTRRLVVVDEDYRDYGLSGELAAIVLEAGIPARFARVCTDETIPFARKLENRTLPNVDRILSAAERLLG